MIKPILLLIRGLPGSGKSTLARKMADVSGAADDYFMQPNKGGSKMVYQFDASKIAQAHAQCQERVRWWLTGGFGYSTVAIANTFTQEWEIAPYRQIAAECDATLVIVSLFDAGLTDAELAARNVHGVPEAAISAMRARWEKVA